MVDVLVLPGMLREEMLAHVRACLPEEACGILGGRRGRDRVTVKQVFVLENELRSPVRFRIHPREQLRAFQQLEKSGMELVGIWHSHPRGPGELSATDLAEAAYPEAALLVWFPSSQPESGWKVRAFFTAAGQVEEVTIVEF